MRNELRVTTAIYIFVALVLSSHIYLSGVKIDKNFAKPIGNSYSVLAAVSKNKIKKYTVYGFLPYWMLHRSEYFQLDKLSDIAYFALKINADGTIMTKTEEGITEPGYQNWRESETLTEVFSKAKMQGVGVALTLISHEDEITYEFLDCRSCWDTLYNSITNELDYRKITDINMDFELFEQDSEGNASTKYSQLVNFLNTKLDNRYGESFVVTSTLPDSTYKNRITDIPTLAEASDALFIMAYDFHRPTSDNAGPVAPINGAGIHSEYDISSLLSDCMSLAPPEKLILGVPYYGYNWLVSDFEDYSERIPGDDVLGYSISQTYATIAETRLKYNPEILWDKLAQTPHFTYINEEKGTIRKVHYENKNSLKYKYQLAKKHNLAGVGLWALGYDGGYQELWQLIDEEFGEVDEIN